MRKRFVRSGLALGLCAALLMPAVASAEKMVWNFNVWGPKRAYTRGIETAKEMMEAADPNFELKIHLGAALAPAKEIPDSIKIGVFESGQFCAGYYPNKVPLLTVLELPFILPPDINKRKAIEHAVYSHPAIQKELASRWNAKYILQGILPPYEFMGNKRIGGVKDMDGVKMRISGLNAKALQTFGAIPTMVTAPETYEALDKGTIDMLGFPWTYAFGAYRLHEVSKFATEGVAMGGFACISVVSLDAWNRTPKKVRDILPKVQHAAVENMIKAYAAADKKYHPIFEKRLEIVPFPKAERAKLAAKAESFWADWAKEKDAKGMPGTELLNFVKEQVRNAG